MPINSTTLRRLAVLEAPVETLREFLIMLADQEEIEEQRRARDRLRKKTGKSMEGDRNLHGNSEENPRKPDNAVDINNTTNSLEGSTSKQQQHSQSVSRGTRLPDDWQPHPNILELARTLGFTDAEYWDHFQRFCDYWRSLSGAKATKLDWNATWRNRVKDLADKLKRGFNGKNPGSIAARFDAIRASIEDGGQQSNAPGPEDTVGLSGLRQSTGRIPPVGH